MRPSPPDELPRGRPAAIAASAYPVRFPASRRRLEGEFTVEQSAWRLAVAYHCHRGLMRAIAGRLIGIPEFEVKIELAHHLYQHAEAATGIRKRVFELRCTDARLESARPPVAAAIAEGIAAAPGTPGLIAVLEGWTAALIETHRDYCARTSSLLDLPSVRTLTATLADLWAMAEWLAAARAALTDAGIGAEEMARAQGETSPAVASLREALERPDPWRTAEPAAPLPRSERARACSRDDRLATFHHTRRYLIDDLPPIGRELSPLDLSVIEGLRTQRDELDAIETFANVLFDDDGHPFEFELCLARFIWDEARHSETGQGALARMGFDPFEIPCGIIGINVRTDLPPLLALTQISTFGELNQVGGLRSTSREAYRAGDRENGQVFDYIHADEMLHVRAGRSWLARLAERDGTTVHRLEETARTAAVQALHSAGIHGEDYLNRLSDRELAALLGE